MKINTTQPTGAGCECFNWARLGGKYMTDHHERCQHHTAGTILVSKVTLDDLSYYDHRIFEALAVANEEPGASVESLVVPQEEYEALPEFDGF